MSVVTKAPKGPKYKAVEPENENRCKRCGECCRIKVFTGKGQRVLLDFYCPALDPVTKLCRIYHQRQQTIRGLVGRPCLSAFDAVALREVPPSCAYTPVGYQSESFSEKRLKLVPPEMYKMMKDKCEKERAILEPICSVSQVEVKRDDRSR